MGLASLFLELIMASKEKLERIKQTVATAKKALSEADVYARADKNLEKLKAGKLGRVARLKRAAKKYYKKAKKAVTGGKKYKTARTQDVAEAASSQMGKGESLQGELKKIRDRGKGK